MVINLFLRTAWVISVIPSTVIMAMPLFNNSASFTFTDLIYPFLAILEQIRRTMWGILKIEYEHITVSDKTAFISLLRKIKEINNRHVQRHVEQTDETDHDNEQDMEGNSHDDKDLDHILGDDISVTPNDQKRLIELAMKKRKSEYIPYTLDDGAKSHSHHLLPEDQAKVHGNLKAAVFHVICGFLSITTVIVTLLIIPS